MHCCVVELYFCTMPDYCSTCRMLFLALIEIVVLENSFTAMLSTVHLPTWKDIFFDEIHFLECEILLSLVSSNSHVI